MAPVSNSSAVVMIMFGLFDKKPVLDEEAVQWLFAAYAWSLRNFDADVFFNETVLVIPSNEYFPGRETSVEGMARLIFEQVRQYAGVQHWPCRLVGPEVPVVAASNVRIEGALRGAKGMITSAPAAESQLMVPYNPHQVTNPEALIADYAHVLAHYLGTMGRELPPGGEENWPYATELLAIFMGFGLMFANSAYSYRGGCGSCYNPLSQRSAFLSQDEATYALAIFSVLKDIPDQRVVNELKKYLRPVYKKAVKEIRERKEDLAKLLAFRGDIKAIESA